MAPGDLQEVLAGLRRPAGVSAEAERNLLVGLGRADDAAVYRLTPDLAIVETVDFFPPVVDDAWTWGAVAAVNAMSDVYAMGGEVLFALAVAGFPRDFDKMIITEVFRGGAEKVAEAGGIIAGGHTVVDAEPKYGLCVTGRVDPDRVLIKGGFRPGDRVFLSKPLGTGLTLWDFTHGEQFTFGWLGTAGFPVWKNQMKNHRMDASFEWRQFFDRMSDPDVNYQFWGGLRYMFK